MARRDIPEAFQRSLDGLPQNRSRVAREVRESLHSFVEREMEAERRIGVRMLAFWGLLAGLVALAIALGKPWGIVLIVAGGVALGYILHRWTRSFM